MRILLTGATGFIGSAIQKKLTDHDLIMTSRGFTDRKQANLFKKNLSSTENFSDCLKDVDIVIHAAAKVHEMDFQQKNSLTEYMETNCFGTLNLARQAAKMGVKRFIFISSIKVNGERTYPNKPFRHDDPRLPLDPYGKSKAEAEIGLLKIAADTQLEATIIRPPLVYGPGVKANFEALLRLAYRNFPMPLKSVTNKRSFVAIDNLISLILECIKNPKAANQVFLVSDDRDVSTPKLYKMMVEAFGKKPKLYGVNPRLLRVLAGFVGKGSSVDRLCEDLRVDIEYTKNLLDWSPVVSLMDGINLCASDLIAEY